MCGVPLFSWLAFAEGVASVCVGDFFFGTYEENGACMCCLKPMLGNELFLCVKKKNELLLYVFFFVCVCC